MNPGSSLNGQERLKTQTYRSSKAMKLRCICELLLETLKKSSHPPFTLLRFYRFIFQLYLLLFPVLGSVKGEESQEEGGRVFQFHLEIRGGSLGVPRIKTQIVNLTGTSFPPS